jgi:hypothetical protein
MMGWDPDGGKPGVRLLGDFYRTMRKGAGVRDENPETSSGPAVGNEYPDRQMEVTREVMTDDRNMLKRSADL